MNFVPDQSRKIGNYVLVLLSFLAIGAFIIVPTVGFQYPLTNILVLHSSLVPVEAIYWMVWVYLIVAFLSLGALLAWLVLYSVNVNSRNNSIYIASSWGF